MNKYDNYKLKIEEILGKNRGKITLTQKISKRNAYIFSVGKSEYLQSNIIFENDEITVFEEGVSTEKTELIKKIFEFNN